MKSSARSSKWSEIEAFETAREMAYARLRNCMQRHVNDFMNLKCAPDMLQRGIFPNAKEITESQGAYSATRYLKDPPDLNDPSVILISVGDGSTPRTAALFAFRSKWQCISIDPKLRKTEWGIDRLWCIPSTVEDAANALQPTPNRVILVAVHSHANLVNSVRAVCTDNLSVIAMPCCVKLKLPYQDPDRSFRDPGVWSPHNLIHVWDRVRQP